MSKASRECLVPMTMGTLPLLDHRERLKQEGQRTHKEQETRAGLPVSNVRDDPVVI